MGADEIHRQHVPEVQESILRSETPQPARIEKRYKAMSATNVRKICQHGPRRWAKCKCPWFFAFKHKKKHWRFALAKELNRSIENKAAAIDAAALVRTQIKEGTFRQPPPPPPPAPIADTITVSELLAVYATKYVAVERVSAITHVDYQIGRICRTPLEKPDGTPKPFGDWPIHDVSILTMGDFKTIRGRTGIIATNRELALLRACLNWAILNGLITRTPFKLNGETAVKLSEEYPRSRRLAETEAAKLYRVCSVYLRAVIEAALETGMRKGEILSLQWEQVLGMQIDKSVITWDRHAGIVLPHQKTKTKKDRTIPLSSRLKGVLELRRYDPRGEPHPLEAHVFGTTVGEKVCGFGRQWETAVLKAHGHEPTYTATKNLQPASRAAFRKIGLHFHDLRREAGSRWVEGGVPLHVVRDWLGHSNVSQTSTYLSNILTTSSDAMARFDALQLLAPSSDSTGENGLEIGTPDAEVLHKLQ